MFDSKYKTRQELRLGGASLMEEHIEPYKPLGLTQGHSIEELNTKRAEEGYFPAQLVTMFAEDKSAVLSLEPLGPDGQTKRDPRVLIKDEASGELVYSPETTKKYYDKIKEVENMQREQASDPEFSYFLREEPSIKETETQTGNEENGYNPPEGMRNV